MSETPLDPEGTVGRGGNGRFLRGNKAARGNPVAKKVQLLRDSLIRATSALDMREVRNAMLALAKDGDVAAAKLLWDRTLGPPVAMDVLGRLEALEQKIGAR